MRASLKTIVILATLCSGCVEGLHNADPQTRVEFDVPGRQMKVWNNKDVDVTIDEVTYSQTEAGGKSFTLKNAKIRDNASDVRTANVGQIDAVSREAAVHYAGIVNWSNSFWGGLNQFASEVMPYVPNTVMASALAKFKNIQTPFGGYQSGIDVSALLLEQREILKKISELEAANAKLREELATRPAQ